MSTAFVPLIEAARRLGWSVELVEACAAKAIKPGSDLTLPSTTIKKDLYFDEGDLEAFADFLAAPWPKPENGKRPKVPSAIRQDVREECHQACAICGSMDNGEVAHIQSVATTLNNSPDNLILLCPNHHSKYDYGFKPASNVTEEEIRSAKVIKRNSRKRRLLHEANATNALRDTLIWVQELRAKLKKDGGSVIDIATVETELAHVIQSMPAVLERAEADAKADKQTPSLAKHLAKRAPAISKAILGVSQTSSARDVRSATDSVAEIARDIFADIDEVKCPRCGGRGTTGLVGDFCAYCRGSCYVSTKKASEYDETTIDQVDCPHCQGEGTTGLVGDLCAYCRGSCLVSSAKEAAYNLVALDEVPCPHCGGKGMTGLVSDICNYCRGSCMVSKAKRAKYDPHDIDEAKCPHCGGKGTVGLSNRYCAFCHGSCVVSEKRLREYDDAELDEVNCPRCGGEGTTGRVGDICKLCKGDCFVTEATRDQYVARFGEGPE